MSIYSVMNTTVTMKAETQTKSATGDRSAPVLATFASNVPARVTEQNENRAMVIYGKYDAIKMKRVYLCTQENIIPGNTWVVWNGVNYSVTSSLNQGGAINKLWACDCIQKPF